jgi:type IV pilus assembly protein PilB
MIVADTTRRLIGDLLLENDLISPLQLEEALKVQRQTGRRLGRILVKLGHLSEEELFDTIGSQLGIRQVNLRTTRLDPALIAAVPENLIRQYKLIPIKKEANKLVVATSDPLNVVAFDDLRLATGFIVEPVLTTEKDIDGVIRRFYELSVLDETMDGSETKETAGKIEAVDLDRTGDSRDNTGAVVRLVNSLVIQAIDERASDIHIEPQKDIVRVRFRVDGTLRDVTTFPKKFQSPLVSRVKILAGMDIAERRVPQDGRMLTRYQGRDVDLRISSVPTVFGEKVVVRVLDKGKALLSVDQLGFEDDNLRKFRYIIRQPHGMILITGPTGSGKSTTLYAIIAEINVSERHLVTIEDPVEYLLPGVTQIQINPKANLTFARGLRAILRQDPDVMMVGEIRDGETAEIATRAAMTGHLVMSTLHTNDAAGAITRLIDMGIEPFLVASTVLGVTAQRLVRLLCPRCREPYRPEREVEHFLAGAQGCGSAVLYRAKGCRYCDNVGYRGRTSIAEVLLISPPVREMIAAKAPAAEIMRQASAEGMQTLRKDGLRKAVAGLTTVEELVRVASAEERW